MWATSLEGNRKVSTENRSTMNQTLTLRKILGQVNRMECIMVVGRTKERNTTL